MLSNRTPTNPSMEIVGELNNSSSPIAQHSTPEKSDRSTSASSAAISATTDADALFRLGERYDKGEGVDVDKAKAFDWYQKPAEKGNLDAHFIWH